MTAYGRRTLAVNPALVHALRQRRVTDQDAADHLARAALILRSRLTRSDAFLTYWAIPWQIVAGIFDGIASAFRGYPSPGSSGRPGSSPSGPSSTTSTTAGTASPP